MKRFIQHPRWLDFKNRCRAKTKAFVKKIKWHANKIGLYWTVLLVMIIVIVVAAVFVIFHYRKPSDNTVVTYPVHRETNTQNTLKFDTPASVSNPSTQQVLRLQAEINAMKSETENNYQSLNAALQSLQASITGLASQHDVQQLQQHLVGPNRVIAGKVNNLQEWVQRILQQTSREQWVSPKVVQHYFRLVAVQGFSDGMRAIIDVDGNQTALSAQEICPVCRGWTLEKMDFANQRAIFYKDNHNTRFFVKLQVN